MGGDITQQSTIYQPTTTSHDSNTLILPNSNIISEKVEDIIKEKEVIVDIEESIDSISSSLYIDPSLYRSSYNAWLPQDDMLNTLQERLSIILNIPKAYLQHKSEELQVVKYNPGGQFKVSYLNILSHCTYNISSNYAYI